MREEKKEPGTHCLCKLSSPGFLGIWKFLKSLRLSTGIIHVSVLSSYVNAMAHD